MRLSAIWLLIIRQVAGNTNSLHIRALEHGLLFLLLKTWINDNASILREQK